MASEWTVDPALGLSKQEIHRLHTRTPEIISTTDFKVILTSIALRHPFTNLRFEQSGTTWVVTGARGTPITAIEFKMAPLAIMSSLRSITGPYIGQVHSRQLLEKITRDIQSALGRKGYLNSKVNPQLKETEDGFVYTLQLDIGDPCVVRGYKWDQTPPITADQTLKTGDICDIEDASKSVAETETKARAAGFADANLTFGGFEFDKGTTTAWVKVNGEFGRKIVYEFVDQTTGRSLSSIFTNSDMLAFDPAILSPDSVSYELIRQLKIRGYSKAQIADTSVQESGKGETIHKFSVLLGETTSITRLQIEGNTSYSDTEIFTLLGIERPSGGEGQASEVIYNPDAISAGVERVRAHYINNGYWDAKVVDRQIESQARDGQTGHIVVVISIDEGEQRLFDNIVITGNESVSTEDLTDLATFSNGSPVNRGDIVTLQQKIRSFYAAKGYFYTGASGETSTRSIGSNKLDTTIIVRVDEGPRVKFGDIFVTGLVKTDPKVVLRELYFDTGDWYDPEMLSQSRKALLRIGVFSSVVIVPLDPDLAFKKSEIVDLVIQVTESPSRTVTFGPGWSSYYGMRYNLEGALTNIGGTGRQLYGRASFNEEVSQKAIGPRTLVGRSISTGYLEPHILDSAIDGTLALSQAARATDYAWSLTRSGEMESRSRH